jgi:hypothetical protein
MKFLATILFLFMTSAVYAERIKSKIYSIDISISSGTPHLIKLENGRVVFVDYAKKKALLSFQVILKNKSLVEIEVDDNNSFISATTIEKKNPVFIEKERESRGPLSFDPTILPTESAALSIFFRMRRDYQNDSQCYNRAHVWAYEEFLYSSLKSKKLFLFFTSRYIRNYRYKWWFHVSPMVLVKQNTSSIERVLDRRYTGGTRTISNWVRYFVTSGRSCPIVHRYTDYSNNQESEDCYLMPVSMYYWQPRDILRRDETGFEKQEFYKSEIDWAYWEAF